MFQHQIDPEEVKKNMEQAQRESSQPTAPSLKGYDLAAIRQRRAEKGVPEPIPLWIKETGFILFTLGGIAAVAAPFFFEIDTGFIIKGVIVGAASLIMAARINKSMKKDEIKQRHREEANNDERISR